MAALWGRLRTPRRAAFAAATVTLGAGAFLLTTAGAETIQRGGVRIKLDGAITPKRLPRSGSAPVKVAVSTAIASTDTKGPPQLTRIQIAINRHGHLDPTGLPVCEVSDIQPSTTQKALEACPDSKVGEGSFSATVALTGKVAFPAAGKLVAFNGTYKGRPAILAHVYGTDPLPTSFTLPFLIGRSHGVFATTLTATLPAAEGNFVTGLDLTLARSFTYRGKRRSYASAGCPAPKGFPGATFPFARVSYSFKGAPAMHATLVRECKARGA